MCCTLRCEEREEKKRTELNPKKQMVETLGRRYANRIREEQVGNAEINCMVGLEEFNQVKHELRGIN